MLCPKCLSRNVLQEEQGRRWRCIPYGKYWWPEVEEPDDATYDLGGLLPPGQTRAYNSTGRNETVRRPL